VKGFVSVNNNGSDNGGRRKKNDRRQFSYTVHIPERRSGMDRRNDGDDRRKSMRKADDLLFMS